MAGDVHYVISAEDQASVVLRGVNVAVSSLATVAGLAASAVGAIGASYVTGVKRIVDEADRINDLSKSLGVSVQNLASWKLAAEQSGTSVEQIGRGIKALSLNMLSHGEALAKIGIDTKNADQAFRQLADIFSAMPDGMDKAALAVKLFNREGMALIPILNEGSAGLERAAQRSAPYAAAMAALAPKADAFKDKQAELSIASQTLHAVLADKLMPSMTNIMTAMAQAAHESGLLMASWVGLGGVAGELSNALPSRKQISASIETMRADGDSAGREKQLQAELDKLEAQSANRHAWGAGWLDNVLPSGGRLDYLRETVQGLREVNAEKQNANYLAAWKPFDDATNEYLSYRKQTEGVKAYANEIEKLKKIFMKNSSGNTGMDADARALESLQLKLIGLEETYSEFDKTVERVTNGDWKSLKDITKANALAMAGEIDEVRESKKVWADFDKATNEYLRHREKVANEEIDRVAAIANEADAMLKKAEAAEYENETIGKTAAELAELTRKRYDEQIAVLKARASSLSEVEGREGETYAIEQQIAALERLKNAEIARPALQQQADEWRRFTDDIERALTDSLMRGFEAGGNFGEQMVKSLTASLKTMFAKFLVGEIVTLGKGTLAGALGTDAAGSMGLGGWVNAASTGSSLYNLYTGYTAGSGSGIAGSVGNYLGGLGAGGWSTTAANTYWSAAGEAWFAGAEGAMMEYGAVASGLSSGAGATGGAAAAAGSLSWMPYVAAAVAVLSMIDWGGGTPHTGATVYSSGAGFDTPRTRADIAGYYNAGVTDNQMAMKDWTKRFSQATADALGPAAEGFAKTFNDIITANGKSGKYTVGLAFSADGEDPVRARSTIIDALGNQIAFAKDNNALGDDPKTGLQRMLTDQVPKLMLTAFRNVDLGETLNTFFDDSLSGTEDYLQKLTDQQSAAFLDLLKAGTLDDIIEKMKLVKGSFALVADSVTNFAPAMAAADQAFQTFTAQLAEVKTGIDATFAGSIRSVKLDVLDNAGKYDFYDKEAARYRDVLSSLTDAEMIKDYSAKLNESIMASWGVLDATQKGASADQYVKLLEDSQKLADERLAQASKDAADQRMAWAASVGEAINNAMLLAADRIAASASIPQQMNLNVNVNGGAAEVTWA